MKTEYDKVLQGSDEWLRLRLGIVTASNVKLIVTEKKREFSAGKGMRTYAHELASQRITNHLEDNFCGDHMERGHIEEVIARDYYSKNISEVKETGFIANRTGSATIGFSPDGLVSDDGIIEIKSRVQKFQTETIAANEVPPEYMLQLQTGLLVSERDYCDFIQFSNGMPLFVKRVFPDIELHEIIIAAVDKFEEEIQKIIKSYALNSADLIKTERVDHDRDDDFSDSEEE